MLGIEFTGKIIWIIQPQKMVIPHYTDLFYYFPY